MSDKGTISSLIEHVGKSTQDELGKIAKTTKGQITGKQKSTPSQLPTQLDNSTTDEMRKAELRKLLFLEQTKMLPSKHQAEEETHTTPSNVTSLAEFKEKKKNLINPFLRRGTKELPKAKSA